VNVKAVWFDSYDEEGTLRSLAWTWTHLAALARVWCGRTVTPATPFLKQPVKLATLHHRHLRRTGSDGKFPNNYNSCIVCNQEFMYFITLLVVLSSGASTALRADTVDVTRYFTLKWA
jgi:hypothetical protein